MLYTSTKCLSASYWLGLLLLLGCACQKPVQDCRPSVYGTYSSIGNIDVVLSEGGGTQGILVQVIFKFSNGVPKRIVNLLADLDERCSGATIPAQISETESIYGQFGVTNARFSGTLYFETRPIDLELEKEWALLFMYKMSSIVIQKL